MIQLFEPSQQLAAALILGSCTLFAALVNAVAQTRVARAAKRKAQEPPRETRRVRRWVVLGAALALALGWSATTAHDVAQAADVPPATMSLGSGVAALMGAGGGARGVAAEGIVVAALELRHPLPDREVVRLLETYDLRPYAIDLRLPHEEQTWLPVPVGVAPGEMVTAARNAAMRRAWQEACAYESVISAASGDYAHNGERPDLDSLGLRLVHTRARSARDNAERLAAGEPVVHALRVLVSGSAATRVATDSVVARAEVVRYDPGWQAPARPEPVEDGCDVVRIGSAAAP